MFVTTLFLIFLAFWPNLSVDVVYSICLIEGVMHKIIAVRELPPKLVFRILVRGEFLNGIWSCFPSACMAIT